MQISTHVEVKLKKKRKSVNIPVTYVSCSNQYDGTFKSLHLAVVVVKCELFRQPRQCTAKNCKFNKI